MIWDNTNAGVVGFLLVFFVILVLMFISLTRRMGLQILEFFGIIKYELDTTSDLKILHEEIIFRGKSIKRAFSFKFIMASIIGIIVFAFTILMLIGVFIVIGEYFLMFKEKIG